MALLSRTLHTTLDPILNVYFFINSAEKQMVFQCKCECKGTEKKLDRSVENCKEEKSS